MVVGESPQEWDAAAMLDALPELVNRYRLSDRTILYCNAAWAAQYHVTSEEAVGRELAQFLSEDDLEGLQSQLKVLGPDNPVVVDSAARAVPDGSEHWIEWVDRYLEGPDGPEVLSVGRDVTARYVAERRLVESEERFRELADSASDIVWRFSDKPHPHFVYISPSMEKILGYTPEYLMEDFTRVLGLLHGVEPGSIMQVLRGGAMSSRFDQQFRHADGHLVICESQTSPLPDGMQGVTRDVTELRALQATLADLALRDPLTGLANRRLINELLDAGLARSRRSGSTLAVVYIDVDGLKNVNDTYGHDAGDAVLRETATRLQSAVRGADVVGRLGGDEFVIVYEPADPASCDLERRLDTILSAPIHISDDLEVRCPASIGQADTVAVGHDAAELLAAADVAMYAAKRVRRRLRDV
jgi:diguanylate cyclase (GGDEF)-like protein/PAS domain S-box-containing protein